MIRTKIRTWLNQTKRYPNGHTFSRAQRLLFTALSLGLLAACITAIWVVFPWLIGSVVTEWKWDRTHTLIDILNSDATLCAEIMVPMMALAVAVRLWARLGRKNRS